MGISHDVAKPHTQCYIMFGNMGHSCVCYMLLFLCFWQPFHWIGLSCTQDVLYTTVHNLGISVLPLNITILQCMGVTTFLHVSMYISTMLYVKCINIRLYYWLVTSTHYRMFVFYCVVDVLHFPVFSYDRACRHYILVLCTEAVH